MALSGTFGYELDITDGFDPDKTYRLEGTDEVYNGEMLMKMGFLMRDFRGDFQSRLYHFVAE